MKIDIYSEAVHSGKSSRLMSRYRKQDLSNGFICPDIYDKRYILHVKTGRLHTFQVDENFSGTKIPVGKYLFSELGFETSRSILFEMQHDLKDIEASDVWVIDEVGKLELKNEGLEPALSLFLQAAKQAAKGRLIIVIRDYLLGRAIEKYALHDATVYGHDEMEL
jgi:nucleoside-triphosphatase THEP1